MFGAGFFSKKQCISVRMHMFDGATSSLIAVYIAQVINR